MNSRRGFLSGLAAAAIGSCVRWLPMPELPQKTPAEFYDMVVRFYEDHCRAVEFYGLGFSYDSEDGNYEITPTRFGHLFVRKDRYL